MHLIILRHNFVILQKNIIMEKAKYILADDPAVVARIRKGLEIKKQRFGAAYCPCVTPLAHSEDTICPCKEYRDSGHCHCGLYKE